MRGRKRAQLYPREYPLEIQQLERLVSLAHRQYPNIALVALYGSVARLSPHTYSDTDLLLLCHNPSLYFSGKPVPDVQLLIDAEKAPPEAMCQWSFSGVVSDLAGSDLDEDFLAEVARDGVLLYQQPGYLPPPVLARLTLYPTWLERVQALLARCESTPRRAGGQIA